MNESEAQRRVRLEYSRRGFVLWRNNIGQTVDSNGRVIRYGVCNPGGSDLIGYRPVLITQAMVGRTIAVIAAIEVKGDGGRVSAAQRNFNEQIRKAGGHAEIIYPGQLRLGEE